MKKSSADKTHLVSLGGLPDTGAIPVFHRWQEWLFSFQLNNLYTEIKTERAIY